MRYKVRFSMEQSTITIFGDGERGVAFMKIERTAMKDFSNAAFPPDTIAVMKRALDGAVASLPDPVSTAHVQSLAETILRTAKDGERDPTTLTTMALLELQITPRL
jgi:hypothetical protein